jgi:hypothetical protein
VRILFLILLFPFILKAQVDDKTLHVWAGTGISVLTSQITFHVLTDERWGVSLFAGGVAGWTAGIVKENIWDASGKGVKDKWDIIATGHGAFIGVIGSTVSFDIHTKRKHKNEIIE